MATYCTPDEWREYSALDVPDDDEDAEAILEVAQVVLDEYVGGGPIPQPDAAAATPSWRYRRFVPSELTPPQRTALMRACAATATWCVLSDDAVLGGVEFTPRDLAVMIRPSSFPVQAARELAGTGLIQRSGCVRTEDDEA